MKIRQPIQWLTVAGVFLPTAFLSAVFPAILEFCALIIGVILIAKICGKLSISKDLFWGIVGILIYQIILILWIHYPLDRFINQYIMLTSFIIAYHILFNFNKNDIHSLFQKYLDIAYTLSILGIIQFIIFYLCSFNIFQIFTAKDIGTASFTVNDVYLRINSILMEPGLLATILIPATTYYIFTIKRSTAKRALIILTALILTFSTIGFVILIFILIDRAIVFLSTKSIYVRLLVWPLLITILLIGTHKNLGSTGDNPSDISIKIKESVEGIKELQPESIELLNLSSYATLMNLYVAQHAPARLTGTGLGNHPYNYEKVYVSNYHAYGLNKNDGYSLFTRLYSETGYIGLALFIFFLIKNYNHSNIINHSVFFLIIAYLLRGGHYTLNGTIFFFFLYYWTNKKHSQCIIQKQ